MFRIECFVKDQKLAEVLRLLDGKVYELRSQPVAKGESDAPKVERAKPQQKRGELTDIMRDLIAEIGAAQFTLADIKARMPSATRKAARNTLERLKRKGELRRVAPSTYAVVRAA